MVGDEGKEGQRAKGKGQRAEKSSQLSNQSTSEVSQHILGHNNMR